MKWASSTPQRGDIIRVKQKFYHHYGIFIDKDTVVQFGLGADAVGPAEDVRVLSSDVHVFSGGRDIECAVLSPLEKARRKSTDAICSAALSRLGEGDYNILHNNCEHFVHLCVFGKKASPEMDAVRREITKKLLRSKQ